MRRGGGDDAFDAGHLGRHDAHMCRGDHGIFAAGHVAADRIHRDVLVAQNDAGQGFDLDILQRRFLVFGEVAHLFVGEADIVQIALGDLRKRGLDLLFTQAESLRRIAVELL